MYESLIDAEISHSQLTVEAIYFHNNVYDSTYYILDSGEVSKGEVENRSPLSVKNIDEETDVYLTIEYHMIEKMTGKTYDEQLARARVPVSKFFSSYGSDEDSILELSVPVTFTSKTSANEVGALVSATVCEFKQTNIPLKMTEEGAFEGVHSKNDWEDVWGPMALPTPTCTSDYSYSFATHRFFDNEEEIKFTAKVIHCLPLRMSAIHLGRDNRMMALVHSIGKEHLPHPKQLAKASESISLKQEEGERAVIVKTIAGDEAIVKGVWKQERGQDQIAVTISTLKPKLLTKSFSLPLGHHAIRLGNIALDFKNQSINISVPVKNASFEGYLGITWGCLLLIALCAPEPDKYCSIPLLCAAGLGTEIPSNHYLYMYDNHNDIPIGDSSFNPMSVLNRN